MGLEKQLLEDMKKAMKSRDQVKLSVIRMVRSAIKKQEIDKREPLTETEVLQLIQKEMKQRKEALIEFEKAGRTDLVEKEQAEMVVLSSYLPKPFSSEELQQVVQETITEIGASSKADIGKVMKAIMPKLQGRADGKEVNQLVQKCLS